MRQPASPERSGDLGRAESRESSGVPAEGGSTRTSGPTGGRRWHLVSRFAAASVVATGISQVAFVGTYWATGLTTLATVLGWLAGAIPNFTLNRRSWGGGQHPLRSEIVRYGAISVGTALLAAVATGSAEALAAANFPDARPARIALVWAAFLGTYAAMFVVKFFLVDRLVFTARPPRRAR